MAQSTSTTNTNTNPDGTTVTTTSTTTRVPLPEPLSREVLDERMGRLVSMIRNNGCTDLAVSLANGIADTRVGGRAINVHRALPQMTAPADPNGNINFDGRLDLDGDNTLEKHELTASLLAAAEVAGRHNIRVSEVPLNEEFINIARQRCAQVLRESDGTCRPEQTPPRR